MQNSFVMRVSDAARDFCHPPYTLARLGMERRCRSSKASARRVFHAEKRQALFTFADLVNRKNVWVIEAGDRLGFAPKAHQRLMRVHLVSKDALHGDDPARVLLTRAINHSHTATSDFLQDFVMTEAPLFVGHVRFRKDAFERFPGGLPFSFKSLAQQTVNTRPVIEPGYSA